VLFLAPVQSMTVMSLEFDMVMLPNFFFPYAHRYEEMKMLLAIFLEFWLLLETGGKDLGLVANFQRSE
jgi:hypothetical protein